jgi:hypothetical protein
LIFGFRDQLRTAHPNDEAISARATRLLVSSPVDVQFEIKILETALGLISGMLAAKFKTTIE